jgi:hypothetical protein
MLMLFVLDPAVPILNEGIKTFSSFFQPFHGSISLHQDLTLIQAVMLQVIVLIVTEDLISQAEISIKLILEFLIYQAVQAVQTLPAVDLIILYGLFQSERRDQGQRFIEVLCVLTGEDAYEVSHSLLNIVKLLVILSRRL